MDFAKTMKITGLRCNKQELAFKKYYASTNLNVCQDGCVQGGLLFVAADSKWLCTSLKDLCECVSE